MIYTIYYILDTIYIGGVSSGSQYILQGEYILKYILEGVYCIIINTKYIDGAKIILCLCCLLFLAVWPLFSLFFFRIESSDFFVKSCQRLKFSFDIYSIRGSLFSAVDCYCLRVCLCRRLILIVSHKTQTANHNQRMTHKHRQTVTIDQREFI